MRWNLGEPLITFQYHQFYFKRIIFIKSPQCGCLSFPGKKKDCSKVHRRNVATTQLWAFWSYPTSKWSCLWSVVRICAQVNNNNTNTHTKLFHFQTLVNLPVKDILIKPYCCHKSEISDIVLKPHIFARSCQVQLQKPRLLAETLLSSNWGPVEETPDLGQPCKRTPRLNQSWGT